MCGRTILYMYLHKSSPVFLKIRMMDRICGGQVMWAMLEKGDGRTWICHMTASQVFLHGESIAFTNSRALMWGK